MCKICSNCKSIMNYDPYFNAEVCVKCGKMERRVNSQISQNTVYHSRKIFQQMIGVKVAH